MITPRVTEIVATKKAKRREFRKRPGNVAGILILRALTQLARVRCPVGETGESDQKLPNMRAQTGRKTVKPIITMRVATTTLMALLLYTADSYDRLLA